MQRSRTTSTPKSGLRSTGSTSSRSSMIFVSTPRDSSSARSSFSSTRTRERSTPTRASLTPVFFGLGSERQGERPCLLHLELRATVRTGDDLAFHGIGADGHVGVAFGTLRHLIPPPALGKRVTANRPRR